MSVVFQDPFVGTLSATNWLDEATPAVWSIDTGELACSTNNFRILKTTGTAHAALVDVQVTARRASGTNFDGCVVARCTITDATSTTGSCYFLNIFGTNSVEFFRRVNSTNTQIGGTFTAAHADGDLFSLKVIGNGATIVLTAYINGVQVATVNDTSGPRITTGGQTGLVVFHNSTRFDDFSVDNTIGPATGTGAPVASNATMAGTATYHHAPASATLAVSNATMAGSATKGSSLPNAWTGTGAPVANQGQVTGVGVRGSRDAPGAIDLTVSNATMSGVGVVGSAGHISATGAPAATKSTVAGAGVLRHTAAGALTVSTATVAGSSNSGTAGHVSGAGAVTISKSTMAGVGIVRHTASGALIASNVVIAGTNVPGGTGGGTRTRLGLGIG